jgi:hypothetical protein
MNDYDSDGFAELLEPSELPEPTEAKPGSKEKIAVLRKRVELYQSLWHDDDSPLVRMEQCSALD